MLLSTSHMSRRTVWFLASLLILGSAAIVRVFYVKEPEPWEMPQLPQPVASTTPVDPLSVPNFAGGVPFKKRVDLPQALATLRQTIEEARPQIQARRDEANKRFPLTGLLVPVSMQATTQRQVDEDYFRYRLLELDSYRQLTRDEPPARQAAEQFLQAYLERDSKQKSAPTWDEVWKLGRAALDAGSQDPLIQFHVTYAQILTRRGDAGLTALLTETLPRLLEHQYPRAIEATARVRYAQWMRDHNERPGQADFWPAAAVAIVLWLEEEAEHPDRRRSVRRQLMSFWENARDGDKLVLLSGCLQSTKVDPWLLHTLLGEHEIRVGWNTRGTSYADKVSEAQWKVFHEHLKHASLHLQYAWHLHPEHPEPAVSMIGVAMADGGDEQNPHEWFLRTIEAQFDEINAYHNLRQALMPRWGGSLEQLQEFGQRCLETDRFDTAVPHMLIHVIENIQWDDLTSDQTLAKDTQAQTLLRQLLARREEFRRRNPGKPLLLDEPPHRTRLASVLVSCELEAEAVAEYLALGDSVDLKYLQSFGRAGAYGVSMFLATQGEVKERGMALARSLHHTWNPLSTPEQVAQTEAELKELTPTATCPQAQLFYRHSETMLRQLRAYSAGEWVPLTFDPEMLGWEVYADDWALDAETGGVRLACHGDGVPRLHLRALAAFRPPFVVEATIELLEQAPFPRESGIHFASELRPNNSANLIRQPLFCTESNLNFDPITKQLKRIDSGRSPAQNRDPRGRGFMLPQAGAHRLRLKLWNNAFEFRIDNSWRSGLIPHGLEPYAGLCIGEPHPERLGYLQTYTRKPGVLRVSNIRIRRLDTPQLPSESATQNDLETYWQTRLVDEPDDPQVHHVLALRRYREQRYDEAIFHARRALEVCPNIEGVHSLIGRIHYDNGRLHAAVEELNLTMAEMQDFPDEAALLAEILASAPDDKLRNGPRAKQLASLARMTMSKATPLVESALAAAHAELGEFDEALKLNASAIERSETDADKSRLQARQDLYKARQPYRSDKRAD